MGMVMVITSIHYIMVMGMVMVMVMRGPPRLRPREGRAQNRIVAYNSIIYIYIYTYTLNTSKTIINIIYIYIYIHTYIHTYIHAYVVISQHIACEPPQLRPREGRAYCYYCECYYV